MKFFIVMAVTGTLAYAGYANRQKLMFWKMNQNRIEKEIAAAAAVKGMPERIRALKEVHAGLMAYKSENSLDPEAYIMSGKADYLLGEAETGLNFSELYLKDSFRKIPAGAALHFLDAVKDISKARALLDGKNPGAESLLVLARSCFYTGFYDVQEIYEILEQIEADSKTEDSEDARFAAVVFIHSGHAESGLELLKQSGKVEDTVQGRLVYARALADAKKFTEAIVAFKNIIDSSTDNGVLRTARLSLGKIYYSQHLYSESLEQFEGILKLDKSDCDSKIWLGKNYLAMGYGDKARAVWAEVLAVNSGNEEVRKLLGLM